MSSRDEKPALFEPDLTKPEGAVVDGDGLVACITCGTRLPLSEADIVGNGYRCPPCTGKAHVAALSTGAVDADAHLSSEDRDRLRAFGVRLLVLGGLGVVAGACLLPFWSDKGYGLIAAGVGSIAVGWSRKRAAG